MGDWFALMRSGRFEEAWALSDRHFADRRSADPMKTPRHLQNIWNGSPIAGRRVLVRCYHGLGDTLQFARYLPRVRDVARTVTVWTPSALMPLLGRSFDGVQFIPLHDGAPGVPYDVDVEIMELPHVFRTTVQTIPCEIPYLSIPALPRATAGTRIGLVWRGGDWDASRSIPFSLIERFLVRQAHVHFTALQQCLTDEERPLFSMHAPIPSVDALADTVASCALVISIDTMTAHLAGALGVPAWTLLKSSADWRWMTGRPDSPWYPSMRLFRQRSAGDWATLLEEVADNLCELIGEHSRR
jgi:hypothetical protein